MKNEEERSIFNPSPRYRNPSAKVSRWKKKKKTRRDIWLKLKRKMRQRAQSEEDSND